MLQILQVDQTIVFKRILRNKQFVMFKIINSELRKNNVVPNEFFPSRRDALIEIIVWTIVGIKKIRTEVQTYVLELITVFDVNKWNAIR